MKKIQVVTGDKYGKLTIVNELKGARYRMFLCKCDCGKEVNVNLNSMRQGKTKSCGCLVREMLIIRNTTHGLRNHRLGTIWHKMMDRCYKSSDKDFHNYGAKGITVCSEWHNIKDFISDMYPTFKEGLTLDRINGTGNYCKDNCRWSTPKEQANNTKKNVWLEYNGEKHTIAQWSEIANMNPGTFKGRIQNGWTIKDAIETPVKVRQ